MVISDCDGITPIENPQLEEWKINVYPNPFNNKVIFNLQGISISEEIFIRVSDLSGKTIWQRQTKGQNQIEWQPTNLSKGMYFYKIKTEDGKTQEGKLIYIQ